MDALSVAKEVARSFDNKLGEDIKILKVEDLTVLTEYFVLATGQSSTQVNALADEAEFRLTELGLPTPRREGHAGEPWILLDCGCVVAHVFTKNAREYYSLEKLWADAEAVEF